MTTEVQCSFLPPYCLSGYICFRALSLRCSFELQGGNAATKKEEKKKKALPIGFVQATELIMKPIIPRPKRRSLLQSSLGRG